MTKEVQGIEDEMEALRQRRKAAIEQERQERETKEFAQILDYWINVRETADENSVEYEQALRAEADLRAAIAGRQGNAGVQVEARAIGSAFNAGEAS